jgi:hypothetical protein
MFLAALELVRSYWFSLLEPEIYDVIQSAVSTALPVIINELSGDQFIWIGSAYALASTAFLPMSGGLAQARTIQPHNTCTFAHKLAKIDLRPSPSHARLPPHLHRRERSLRRSA